MKRPAAKKIIGIALALMFAGSVLTMVIPQAFGSHTSGYGTVTMQVSLIDLNGKPITYSDSVKPTLAITDAKTLRQIKEIEITTKVFTPAPSSDTISSTSGITAFVQVLKRDGSYDIVKQLDVSKERTKTSTGYIIYKSKVALADIERVIGSCPDPKACVDFNSELRVTSGKSGSMIGFLAGKQGTFYVPQTVLKIPIIKSQGTGLYPAPGGDSTNNNDDGQGDSGGTGSETSDAPIQLIPTGKIYSKVSVQWSDGTWHHYTKNELGSLKTLSIQITGDGTPLKAIKYTLYAFLDKDVFVPATTTLSYTDGSSTENFSAKLDGTGVNKAYDNDIQRDAQASHGEAAQYQLLEMVVTEDDLKDALKPVEGGLATNPDGSQVQFTEGTLVFSNKPSILKMRSPEKTFNIEVPKDKVTLQITGLKQIEIVDSEPNCEIEGEQCEEEINDNVSFFANPIFAIAMGVIVAGSIGGIAIMRKK